jgi:23S rRNA pseudouridine955/2504/2580 synthase
VRVEQAGGQAAKTVFYRRRVWTDIDPPMSLLEAELHTGRTHQIRVHLTHLGFALAGDQKYGDFAWNKTLSKQGLKRMFLHARRLAFTHPVEQREVEIEAALPLELSRYLDALDSVRRPDA